MGDDEFDIAVDEPPTDDATATRRRRGRWSAAAPWAAMAAALVVVGGLAAPDGGIGLGGLPGGQVGMLDVDLAAPPTTVWATDLPGDATDSLEPYPRLIRMGEAVISLWGDVTALDVNDGSVIWTADVGAAHCSVHDAVTCVQSPGTTSATIVRPGTDASPVSLPGAVVAVDVGDDLVVLSGGLPLTVTRMGPDGTTRWEQEQTGYLEEWDIPQLDVVGDRVYVQTQKPAVLDVGSGESTVGADEFVWLERLPSGYLVFRLGAGRVTRTVVDADGGTIVAAASLVVDDDPGGMTIRGGATGYEIVRGSDVLWSVPTAEHPIARIDGVLICQSVSADGVASTLIGHDEVTGDQLWRTTDAIPGLLGGGSTLLGTSGDGGGLMGLDVATGTALWSDEARLATGAYLALPDGLVAIDDGRVVRLRW